MWKRNLNPIYSECGKNSSLEETDLQAYTNNLQNDLRLFEAAEMIFFSMIWLTLGVLFSLKFFMRPARWESAIVIFYSLCT